MRCSAIPPPVVVRRCSDVGPKILNMFAPCILVFTPVFTAAGGRLHFAGGLASVSLASHSIPKTVRYARQADLSSRGSRMLHRVVVALAVVTALCLGAGGAAAQTRELRGHVTEAG